MSDLAWILWTILGIVLIIAEIFTPGFVLMWFGVGALVAAFGSYLGLGLAAQFVLFILVSSLLTALSRTIFVNYFSHANGAGGGLRSGAEALPGQVGTVVTSSSGALNEGAVKVFGSTWTAYPAEGEEPLEAGDRVVVESLRGASIYVRRVGALPDWRGRELTEGEENS
ncbi:MAG TPA: NfeD family protein [Pyrinomonadaceae bacterium]|nr:NfeD family protein [Pyrinomonadaceae bacterium]